MKKEELLNAQAKYNKTSSYYVMFRIVMIIAIIASLFLAIDKQQPIGYVLLLIECICFFFLAHKHRQIKEQLLFIQCHLVKDNKKTRSTETSN